MNEQPKLVDPGVLAESPRAFWINAFPNRSENFGFSPRDIMTGLSTDYDRDCKVDIGSYVEASTDATATNDNTERTRSCVALGPVGNRQGSVKCFDIESGKILHQIFKYGLTSKGL